MNQLDRYRELLNEQGKIVQLLEFYRNAGVYVLADKYVQEKWKNYAELTQLRNELRVASR